MGVALRFVDLCKQEGHRRLVLFSANARGFQCTLLRFSYSVHMVIGRRAEEVGIGIASAIEPNGMIREVQDFIPLLVADRYLGQAKIWRQVSRISAQRVRTRVASFLWLLQPLQNLPQHHPRRDVVWI